MGTIQSRLRELKAKKEIAEARKLSLDIMTEETGISRGAIHRLMMINKDIGRLDTSVIIGLCEYFGCGLCDLLVYVPSDKTPSNQD
jgi:DNA-binding Xre family transcriptional regulator